MSENSNLTLPASAPPRTAPGRKESVEQGFWCKEGPVGQSPVSPPRERTDGSDRHQIPVVPLRSKEKEHGSMRGRWGTEPEASSPGGECPGAQSFTSFEGLASVLSHQDDWHNLLSLVEAAKNKRLVFSAALWVWEEAQSRRRLH